MASVRMSNTLRVKIENAASFLFTKSTNKIVASFATDFHDRAAKEFVAVEFQPHISAGNIPIQYLTNINQVTYKINYVMGNAPTEYAWDSETLINPIKIIKLYDFYSEGFGKSKILTIPDGFSFSKGLEQELSDWRNKLADCRVEESDFMAEIKRITKRCNTVKQFLDTWPQGENLLPAEILRNFNKKPEKREKIPIITEEASITLSATLLKRTIMS